MTGIKRINRAIAKFTDIIKELETGVADVNEQIDTNQGIIASLKAENKLLDMNKIVGLNMIHGINNLIGAMESENYCQQQNNAYRKI